ncbi:MAG TPA: methyltransferase domain-containing protein [Bacteriovoracaceae bacterium]|nr:methyltransferase domain-containing protein [Bacteriovoracaceae bacterium]
MSYILENINESERLEKQNAQPQYSIEQELSELQINLNGKKILDAGCGAGSLSKILAAKFSSEIHACDASELRIHQARKSSPKNIKYFVADLTSLGSETYDVIFVRYVLEHTLSPGHILQSLYQVLRPGGHLVVIDFDGLIFNLHHQDEQLGKYLGLLQQQLPIDLFIGRKLPRLLADIGLNLIDCRIQSIAFKAQELEAEVNNMIMRFDQSAPLIQKVIGPENFDKFVSSYISEMRKCQVLFCSKFIITSTKPQEKK